MAAPSGKLPLPPEAYAALGDFRSAIKELKKVQNELQNTAQQAIAAKGQVDPALRMRLDKNKAQMQAYAQEDKLRKVAAAEGKQSAAKTVFNLINSHNPHGVLRGILHGSQATGTGVPNIARAIGGGLQSLGTQLKSPQLAALGTSAINAASSVAGIAGITAFLAHKIASMAEEHQHDREEVARMMNTFAGRSLSQTRQFRFGGVLTGADLLNRKGEVQSAGAFAESKDYTLGDRLSGALGLDRTTAQKKGIESKERTLQMSEARRVLGQIASQGIQDQLQPGSQRNNEAVKLAAGLTDSAFTNIRQLGLLTWAGRRAKRALGFGDPELDEEDEKMRLRIAQSEITKRQDAMKGWYEIPENRASAHRQELHLRAIESFQIERAGQWNPI